MCQPRLLVLVAYMAATMAAIMADTMAVIAAGIVVGIAAVVGAITVVVLLQGRSSADYSLRHIITAVPTTAGLTITVVQPLTMRLPTA